MKLRCLILFPILLVLAAGPSSSEETDPMRTWTSVKGTTMKAEFLRQTGASVVLKTDTGQQTMIRLSALSQSDQKYVKEIVAAKRSAMLTSRSKGRSSKSEPGGITADYLSRAECEVIEEINFARTEPQEYVKHLEKVRDSHLGDGVFKTEKGRMGSKEGLKAVLEAIEFLKEAKPVKPLKPSKGLSLAAKSHADDIGPAGVTGHTGTKGSTMTSRINAQGKWQNTIGENIAFGRSNPRSIVVQLIIDDGVPSRGHRKNIYKKDFGVAGVCIGPHKQYGSLCVIDFAGGFSD